MAAIFNVRRMIACMLFAAMSRASAGNVRCCVSPNHEQEKSKKRTKRICDEIIDVSISDIKELTELDDKRERCAENNNGQELISVLPEQREHKAERHQHDDVQNKPTRIAIAEVRDHVCVGKERIPACVREIEYRACARDKTDGSDVKREKKKRNKSDASRFRTPRAFEDKIIGDK